MKKYDLKTYGTFTLVKNFSTGAPPVTYQIEILIDGQALARYLSSAITNKSGLSKLAHGAIVAVNKYPGGK